MNKTTSDKKRKALTVSKAMGVITLLLVIFSGIAAADQVINVQGHPVLSSITLTENCWGPTPPVITIPSPIIPYTTFFVGFTYTRGLMGREDATFSQGTTKVAQSSWDVYGEDWGSVQFYNGIPAGTYNMHVDIYDNQGHFYDPWWHIVDTYDTTVTVGAASETPTINWNQPADIVYGTPLSDQLNAVATYNGNPVSGSDVYTLDGTLDSGSPIITTESVLSAGMHTLYVKFTPSSDQTTYTTATASVSITVDKAKPTVTWNPNPATIVYKTG
jgi:hypothetical protein